jgi:hypothetical protein
LDLEPLKNCGISHCDSILSAVLPRGRNVGRKAQKGLKKFWQGRESQGLNFLTIYQKRAEKGPNFF